MIGALLLLPHLVLMLAAGPVLAGLLRRRAPARQAWRDLLRLARKAPVRLDNGSFAELAPALSAGASLVAALLVPSFTLGMATAPLADLILVAGLLGLGRAARVLAGVEAGTGLAGLAAQRVAVLRVVADPALLVLILVVAVATGTSNLDAASAVLRDGGLHWPLIPAAAGAACVLLAGAEPEALVGEFSGRDLAVLHFAAQLRAVTVLSLLAALVLPPGLASAAGGPEAGAVGAALWVLKLAALAAIGAALSGLRARLRPDQAPELAALGLVLALLAAALLFVGQRAA